MRHGTWILIVGLLLAPLGYGLVDSEAATIDQQQPIIDSTVGGLAVGGSSEQKLAQVVTAGVSGFLTGIRLPVSCGTGQLVVEIQGVDEDMPNGVVLTSESIPASSLRSIGAAFRTIALSEPVFLSAGDVFAIVVSSTGACGLFQGPTGDSYTGGDAFFDSRPNAPGWICGCEFQGARFDLPFETLVTPILVSPAKVWVGIGDVGSTGIRIDLKAKVYLNGTLAAVGQHDSLSVGVDPHYAYAKLRSIPLKLTDTEVEVTPASELKVRVLVRNACTGSGQPSGTIRLWYNGTGLPTGLGHGADSHVDINVEGSTSSYFLRSGLALDTTTGSSREWAAAEVGEPCGPWVPFGTWSVTVP